MKAICVSMLVMTLMAAPAPISAQDAPQPPPVTQRQFQQTVKGLKAREYRNARTIRRDESQICALAVQQAKQGNAIASIAGQQHQDVAATKSAAKDVATLQKSNKALGSKASHEMLWLAILTAVVVVAICGGAYFARRVLQSQRAKEIIHINPDVVTLRSLWGEKKSPIPFTMRLKPKPEKGFLDGGDVSGYVATFDNSLSSKPLSEQYPKITYKGESLRLEQLPKHAASVLGLKAAPAPPVPGTKQQLA